MSFFAVEKKKISKTMPIEGADRIEMAQVEGLSYQFVVGKGQFPVGSDCIFFPIDSLLPKSLVDHFGIEKFLSGKDHNRVKTAKFKGCYSQGYVASVDSVHDYISKVVYGKDTVGWSDEHEDFYTRVLGVTKYESPEIFMNNATLTKLDMAVYDIEGVSRYQNVVDSIMDEEVLITEKMEGMNMHLTLKHNGELKIGQRGYYITSNDPENPHSFEKNGKKDLLPIAEKLQNEKYPNSDVRIRAEFLGDNSQGNYYGIKGNKSIVFEIDVNGRPLNAKDVLDLVKEYSIPFAPIIFAGKLRDFLNGKTIQEMSHGKSALVDKFREGLVIRPLTERNMDGFGRVIIKHRSEQYLAKTDF